MPTIIDYQPTWSAEFAAIAAILRGSLGDLALRIDHIGSTSVPRLAAKDIIDVQIAVATLTPEVLAPLTALGYTRSERIVCDHRPPNSTGPDGDWEKWFLREPQGQRMTNTHVRVLGRPNQRYPLLFRDYLRAHPATAAAYAELKRRLARELADPITYTDVKDPAVDLIYFAAEDWAAITGWQMGPSDA